MLWRVGVGEGVREARSPQGDAGEQRPEGAIEASGEHVLAARARVAPSVSSMPRVGIPTIRGHTSPWFQFGTVIKCLSSWKGKNLSIGGH